MKDFYYIEAIYKTYYEELGKIIIPINKEKEEEEGYVNLFFKKGKLFEEGKFINAEGEEFNTSLRCLKPIYELDKKCLIEGDPHLITLTKNFDKTVIKESKTHYALMVQDGLQEVIYVEKEKLKEFIV